VSLNYRDLIIPKVRRTYTYLHFHFRSRFSLKHNNIQHTCEQTF
jgi:hypothetical protein